MMNSYFKNSAPIVRQPLERLVAYRQTRMSLRVRNFLNFFQVVSNSARSLDASELSVRSFVLPPRTSQVLARQHAAEGLYGLFFRMCHCALWQSFDPQYPCGEEMFYWGAVPSWSVLSGSKGIFRIVRGFLSMLIT